MAGDPPNVLSSAELKRRGIAAIEEALREGPVHLMKRNQPAAVVMSEEHYRRLQHRASQPQVPEISSLEWLLQQTPSTTGRTKAEIDAELSDVRNW
jgi:prevent-host-death family protein